MNHRLWDSIHENQLFFFEVVCSVVIWDREIVQRVVSARIIPGNDRWDVYNLNTSFISFQKLVHSDGPYNFLTLQIQLHGNPPTRKLT